MFLIIKTSSQNISITLLQISLKLHEHRGCYWRKELPWTILEEQFSVSRYTVASKIGNTVISLLWQLRCRCNPDHNNFSSLSNTTVVAIFLKLCLWRRSLGSNLGGIGPEKLYRATLSLLLSKILLKEDTLFTHTKSDDPPAPDCLLVQMTIFHLQIRWFLLHSATNHILYTKQRPPLMIFTVRTTDDFSFHVYEERQVKKIGQWTPILQLQCNNFNIFSGTVDQIRSKKRNSKHVLHWSRLLLNIRWLKPTSEFLLISRKKKLFVYETYTIEKKTVQISYEIRPENSQILYEENPNESRGV